MTSPTSYTQEEILTWALVVVRGLTKATPYHLKLHTFKDYVFILATFQGVKEPEPINVGLILKECKGFAYTPGLKVEEHNFYGEWPPRKLIKELSAPQLVSIDGGKLKS